MMIKSLLRVSTVKVLILLAGLILMFAIACGGDDDSAGDSAAAPAAEKKAEPTVVPKKSVHEEAEKKDDSAASGAAATATVAAAKKDEPTATAAPVVSSKYGGTLNWGTAPNNNHVFFQQYTPGAGAAWAMNIGDPLMAYGKGSEWLEAKSMAESFEVSPDGQTITFKLKKGVKLHDGTDYNAPLHKWNLDWVLNPDNAAVTRPQISAIDKVTAIDDYTLEVHTDRVYTPLLNALGMMGGMPFSREEYESKGEDHLKTYGSSSNGPFMIEEWIQGEKTVFAANPNYHQKDTYPYLDEIVWVEIADEQVRGAALETGQVDVADINSKSTDVIAALRNADNIFEAKGMAGVRLSHHNAARAPFDDIRVRQAAQMAIDRHAWNDILQGGEGHVYMGSVLPPTSAFAYKVDEYMYEYDPEAAKALLEEYAAEKGLTLPLTHMDAFKCTDEQLEIGCTDLEKREITVTVGKGAANAARAEFEAAAFNAVGFEVTMDIAAGKEGPRTFVTKESSFSLRGFGVRPHPAGSMDSYMGYGGYWNNGSYGTSDAQMELHETLKLAGQAFDYQEQVRLYKKCQQIYLEHALGGVKLANAPSYKFWTTDLRYDGYPDFTEVFFPSDTSLKMYGMYLER